MDANVELVRRLYDAFAASDFDTILAVMDPELVVTQADALPWGGEFHGYEGLATFFGRLREHITSEVTHAALYGAGDHAVQFGDGRHRQRDRCDVRHRRDASVHDP